MRRNKKNGLTSRNWTDSLFLRKSDKSKNFEAAGSLLSLPDLSRKIEETAHRVRTSERYYQHSKIKFVSPSGHVMFCSLYRY